MNNNKVPFAIPVTFLLAAVCVILIAISVSLTTYKRTQPVISKGVLYFQSQSFIGDTLGQKILLTDE